MACAQFYVVRDGDTLFSIAEKFNTTPQNIIRLNEGITAENLIPSTRICVISATFQPVVCPVGTLPYNVNPGDTLSTIAKKFGTDTEALLSANPEKDPFNLKTGQRICIAQKFTEPPMCESRNYYVIRRGDTLGSIAASFEITTRELLSVNPGINPRSLSIGQIICLPLTPSPFEIIVNVRAKRLTVYRNGSLYREYIVATGKPETPTPTGIFKIVNKEIDPGGPYGTRWLGLSAKGYGIHGTNNPQSIGTAASNGCIRMYNEDIEALFDITNVGTIVRILP